MTNTQVTLWGDLNKRRGRVLGMNPTEHGYQEIVADIPYMELYGYNTDLRSMTGGSGTFSYEFARYEQTPSDIQEKEIAERGQANLIIRIIHKTVSERNSSSRKQDKNTDWM